MALRRRNGRSQPRRRCFLTCQVLFGTETERSLDGVLLDISPQGARIAFPYAARLPRDVIFCMPDHDIRVSAHLRWRNGGQVGILFQYNEADLDRIAAVRLDAAS